MRMLQELHASAKDPTNDLFVLLFESVVDGKRQRGKGSRDLKNLILSTNVPCKSLKILMLTV